MLCVAKLFDRGNLVLNTFRSSPQFNKVTGVKRFWQKCTIWLLCTWCLAAEDSVLTEKHEPGRKARSHL